jgi:hypothetical protein
MEFLRKVAEEYVGDVAETDEDLGNGGREALTGPEVEGDARPPPVVHEELQGREGFGGGIRNDSRLRAVARHPGPVH